MGAFWTYLGIGAAISIGGTVMILAGSNMSPNITPYGRAAALAEKYNTQLLIKITGKDPNKPRTPDNGST
jgi:uridylate kinase